MTLTELNQKPYDTDWTPGFVAYFVGVSKILDLLRDPMNLWFVAFQKF